MHLIGQCTAPSLCFILFIHFYELFFGKEDIGGEN